MELLALFPRSFLAEVWSLCPGSHAEAMRSFAGRGERVGGAGGSAERVPAVRACDAAGQARPPADLGGRANRAPPGCRGKRTPADPGAAERRLAGSPPGRLEGPRGDGGPAMLTSKAPPASQQHMTCRAPHARARVCVCVCVCSQIRGRSAASHEAPREVCDAFSATPVLIVFCRSLQDFREKHEEEAFQSSTMPEYVMA